MAGIKLRQASSASSTSGPAFSTTIPISTATDTPSSASSTSGPAFSTTIPISTATATPSSSVDSTTSTSASTSTSSTSPTTTAATTATTATNSISSSSVTHTSSSGISPGPTHTSNRNISAGAAAGIGIGTALIGALLALVAIWFIMRKRSAHEGGHHRRSHKSDRNGKINDEENFIGARSDPILEGNLLQRADDSQIRKGLLDLNEVIDQHCENNYHLGDSGVSQHDLERRIDKCGYSSFDVSGSSISEFASLLQNPHSRLTAIRQLIAMVLFAHIDWRSSPETSLLPPQIAAFCQTIAPIEKQPGSEKIFEEAFLRWRHLSAFLIEPFRSNRGTPKLSKEEVRAAIERNVALLNLILKLFIKPGDGNVQYQEENLAAITFEIAQFGLLIFSQPSEWVFDWPREATHASGVDGGSVPRKSVGRDLVVFPGIGEIIETGDERHLRTVAHPVMVKI